MKAKIAIFINGPINSGKSTVARELSRLLSGIYIDGDDLMDHGAISISFELLVTQTVKRVLSEVFRIAKEGPVPIVAYPLRNEDWLLVKRECLQANLRTIVITLAPPLHTALSNRGGRVLTSWEIIRIKEMYEQGYHQREFSDLVLANDLHSAKQSAEEILHFVDSQSY